jgi:hypothetical protein
MNKQEALAQMRAIEAMALCISSDNNHFVLKFRELADWLNSCVVLTKEQAGAIREFITHWQSRGFYPTQLYSGMNEIDRQLSEMDKNKTVKGD